jgi:glutathione synthase/RimK-type ligase-like ATP-grasp enzyme
VAALQAEAYDFYPLTFTLPMEGAMMLRAFKEKGGVWIMKPVGGRQGKGIFLVNKPSQIDTWLKQSAKEKEVEEAKVVSYVAQKYIHNPYLVVRPHTPLNTRVRRRSGCHRAGESTARVLLSDQVHLLVRLRERLG